MWEMSGSLLTNIPPPVFGLTLTRGTAVPSSRASPKKPTRVAAPSPRASLGRCTVCGRTEQHRPPVSKRYETKVRMVWGSFLVAAAALKTPTRNGYNAQGVNLTACPPQVPTARAWAACLRRRRRRRSARGRLARWVGERGWVVKGGRRWAWARCLSRSYGPSSRLSSAAQCEGRRCEGGSCEDEEGRCKKINRSHAHTHRQNNTPDTDTHTRQEQHPKPPNEHLLQTLNNARVNPSYGPSSRLSSAARCN